MHTLQDQDLLSVRLRTGPLARSGYLWGGAARAAGKAVAQAAAASGPAPGPATGTDSWQQLVARVLREQVGPDARRSALACVFFPDARTAAADEEGAQEEAGADSWLQLEAQGPLLGSSSMADCVRRSGGSGGGGCGPGGPGHLCGTGFGGGEGSGGGAPGREQGGGWGAGQQALHAAWPQLPSALSGAQRLRQCAWGGAWELDAEGLQGGACEPVAPCSAGEWAARLAARVHTCELCACVPECVRANARVACCSRAAA